MRRFALMVLIGLLAVRPFTPAAAGEINADVKTVGIVSLLGDTITLQHFGVFLDGFSHERELAGAGFDDVAETLVEHELQRSRPGLDIKRIALDKSAVIKDYTSGFLAKYNADVSGMRKAIAAWVAQNPVDLIVIVRQVNRPSPVSQPEDYFRGLGLYDSFAMSQPRPLACIGVIVWDGHTLDHIDEVSVAVVAPVTSGFTKDHDLEPNLEGVQRDVLVDNLKLLLKAAVPQMLVHVGL